MRWPWQPRQKTKPALTEELPGRTARLTLLAALLLVVAPQTLNMSVWLGLFALALIVWRWQAERRGWGLPGRRLRLLITLLGIVAVASSYHSLVGRDAGTALLTLMLCLKLLEMRSLRDAMLMLFLSYFLITAGFLYSQSMFAGAYMLVAALGLTTALVVLAHPAAQLRRLPDYGRTALIMLAQAIPLMLLLFVLFPRINGPLWGLPHDAFSGRTGLSDNMQMGAISSLADSDEVAFRVQFDGPIPAARELYWRGPVLWFTDGRNWTGINSPQRRRSTPMVGLNDAVNYEVTLEPHTKQWIFALDLPSAWPSEFDITPSYQLLSRKPVNRAIKYRVSSHTDYWAEDFPDWQRRYGLYLPSGANPRSLALARQWRAQGLDEMALVQRALTLFRDQPFYYTREPPLLGDDPVDQFIFSTQRGFCEHYAASFTVLMRAAGLPARVVTGYQGGERNPIGNYLVVRQANAHAWSEVYLTDRGWTRIDPTAVIPPERVEYTADLGRFESTEPMIAGKWSHDLWRLARNTLDSLDYQWQLWVIGYNTERQRQLLRRLGIDQLFGARLGLLLVGLVGGLLALYGVWMALRGRRSPDPLLRLYRRLLRKLERAGVTTNPAEGPHALATRLRQQAPAIAQEVVPLLQRYADERYGPTPSSVGLKQLREGVAKLCLPRSKGNRG